MLPLNPILKDAFEKFEQDFLASNLPEGKYIKPPASTAKYYKVGQSCFEDKLQELNADFAKICISPKRSGAPMGKVPLQVIKHFHQWLHSSIHLKTKFSQSSPDSIRLQGPSKRPSSGLLYPVSSVKECNIKRGKCKISRVLQSPVSGTQASPTVEVSNKPKQAQHLPTCRKVQNGNTRVHQGLSDSRGIGVFDRPIRCLLSHPQNSRKLAISG